MTSDKHTQRDIKTRLLIIGAGGSGLAAAVSAMEHGVEDITIIEKRRNVGGNTALAGGLFACESPVQAREKMVADRDQMFKKAMNWTRWSQVNPAIIRDFINKSGDTIHWLEKKGLGFKLIKLYPDQNPLVHHCPIGGGARLVKTLKDEAVAAGVRVLTKTSAQSPFMTNGVIQGVIARDDRGAFRIKADRVILATGGFAGNSALLNKLCSLNGSTLPVSGLPLTGDGIVFAEEAGAAIEVFATMIKEGPRFDLHQWPLLRFERDPSTLWVNQRGQRFVDETLGYRVFEAVNAMLSQPGNISFALLDDAIREQFEIIMPGLKVALEKEVSKQRVIISDTIEGLAGGIGAKPEVLRQTIDRYNRSCEKGYDEEFAKERRYLIPLGKPPFYAIKGLAALLDTIGGIRINHRMEVLDMSQKPIPGLFAVGVVTSGWQSETYCSDLSGGAFGFAVNSGRIAGENVARSL